MFSPVALALMRAPRRKPSPPSPLREASQSCDSATRFETSKITVDLRITSVKSPESDDQEIRPQQTCGYNPPLPSTRSRRNSDGPQLFFDSKNQLRRRFRHLKEDVRRQKCPQENRTVSLVALRDQRRREWEAIKLAPRSLFQEQNWLQEAYRIRNKTRKRRRRKKADGISEMTRFLQQAMASPADWRLHALVRGRRHKALFECRVGVKGGEDEYCGFGGGHSDSKLTFELQEAWIRLRSRLLVKIIAMEAEKKNIKMPELEWATDISRRLAPIKGPAMANVIV